jgi:cysteine desulfurase
MPDHRLPWVIVEERAYFDHAATTSMVPAAREAWLRQSALLGNPSSLHASGRRRRQVVEESRESIAALLGTRPSAVVFTAGGTEADNLAIKGLFWGARRVRGASRIAVSTIEHHAVLDPVLWLEREQQAKVEWLDVDAVGRIDEDRLAWVLNGSDDLALCSVMWANNEIGTVQPVDRIASLCRDAGVPFHTDGVQVLGHVPIDLDRLGATAVTFSSHKIGGPFGAGALILDPQALVDPVLHGGGQEREVRSGTLDAPAIAGFAAAVEHAVGGQRERAEALVALRESLIRGLVSAVPGVIINGDRGTGHEDRLPGNVHASFPGCEGDLLLMLLDAAGIDCSTGSACTAGIPEPSHVLLALGRDETAARSSLRFSMSEATTQQEVDRLLAAVPLAVDRASRAGAVGIRVD